MHEDRAALRRRLLDERRAFADSSAFAPAQAALAEHLSVILHALEPSCLGAYWPMRGEFNVALLWSTNAGPPWLLALPHARRVPPELTFRAWDGAPPAAIDDCGVPTADGAPAAPDVVLVPCVGHTRAGGRLGYGGGYFDRWLAAHPHVTAVGVSWSGAEIGEADFAARPHDLPLALIVTERGVVG